MREIGLMICKWGPKRKERIDLEKTHEEKND